VIVNRSGVIAASGGDVAARGRYALTASLPAGGYMLKAAVIDSAGRRGSVERHFEVKMGKAGQATFGDLMVAEPGPDSGTGLSMHPVVAMVRGSDVIAYMELYGPETWAPGPEAVRLETVSDGEAGGSAAPLPAKIERTAPGRWTVTAQTTLAPGSGPRFLRATITAPGGDPTQITRVFSLERRN
jgi:hypothetical protein